MDCCGLGLQLPFVGLPMCSPIRVLLSQSEYLTTGCTTSGQAMSMALASLGFVRGSGSDPVAAFLPSA